ncbi:IclR family transcriptional regulator [Natrarchaeobius chitinivorans]|uniref:IclR family transcriptional regulator n=1 Tax=Natrarchaeobius chitinivorans TaxID=1679083 RepID=A0A3N6M3M0_NATCH|nr:IclR family transcriptional regulator [Natrarchaeobius chitinivorans]RQG96517.1 IclR family transcriptional regulator [Natrarchaeobius chitinivorans]
MAGNDTGDSEGEITSVLRGFEILELLKNSGPMTVSEVSEELDLPWSTTHIYLQTLVKSSSVIRTDNEYDLSYMFLHYGGEYRQRSAIFETARKKIDELAQETGEIVDLGVEEDGQRVLIYKSEGKEGIYDNPPIGEYTNMHWTALGKVLLAQQSDERVKQIVSQHGLPQATEYTITKESTLFDRLDEIRERGFAIEDEERRLGVKGIAAPILDQSSEEAPGALSISGPKNRFHDDRISELAEYLNESINIIELKYNYN